MTAAVATYCHDLKHVVQKQQRPNRPKQPNRPYVRRKCPCGREPRRCKTCPDASRISLCPHGREKFRARRTCCPDIDAVDKATKVTLMPANVYVFYKLKRLIDNVKVGTQCTLTISTDRNGNDTITLDSESSLQDLRVLMNISDSVDLSRLGTSFTAQQLADLLNAEL